MRYEKENRKGRGYDREFNFGGNEPFLRGNKDEKDPKLPDFDDGYDPNKVYNFGGKVNQFDKEE